MGFRLTDDADQDIAAIAELGIEMFGLDQSRAYHDALFNVFDLIAENPRMGRERTEFTPPVRVHPFRSHIVLYQIEDSDILIIRVRHAHEDWMSQPDRPSRKNTTCQNARLSAKPSAKPLKRVRCLTNDNQMGAARKCINILHL